VMFQEISILISGYKVGEVIRTELLEILFTKVVLKERRFRFRFRFISSP
jgi:hypothetical protein